jgi:putative DNA primase/helicase
MSDIFDQDMIGLAQQLLASNDEKKRQFFALYNNPSKLPQSEAVSLPDAQPSTTWADMANVIGPVKWEWPGWLAKGMLTILAGESGAGKSALALRICGCYLCGWPWPDGCKFTGETGAIVWCEAEAAQAVNLDRAKAWGLPIDKIYTPLADPLDDVKLDIPEHAAALAQKAMLPEVRLIIVDSLRGMHRGDENSSETMNTIKWLAELTRDSGKSLILTHHLRKRSLFDGEGVELERLRGSSAIVQTARLVWALDVPDPKIRDIKRMQVIKSNLSKFPDPVGVTIDGTGVKFVDAPETPKIETKLDQAIDLLMALLQANPVAATQIETEFNQAGISNPTMKKAKAKLGVVSVKTKTGWMWSLPAKESQNGLFN